MSKIVLPKVTILLTDYVEKLNFFVSYIKSTTERI